MDHLELKSPHDGALLILEVTDRFPDSVEFTVQIKTRNFSGSAPSSTFMAVPLETWFQSMASDWEGWKDEKKWGDLESRVQFSATADKTGHIKMKVVLAGQDYDSELRVNIMFEAGQLDGMAHDVARLFA
ncbi:hypothetical protein EV582_4116 [Duganella sp. BK701]|uniref:DUF6228 family protein n=1 Tax=unclassified Duganella TaxID=2636909 RepID=UPI000B83D736|nr:MULTISPECIES: DUF6228 family protein [unclassified Duganella]RZT05797.1 hypothetical protein EV582_4116 [Duganella sp. BK701]